MAIITKIPPVNHASTWRAAPFWWSSTTHNGRAIINNTKYKLIMKGRIQCRHWWRKSMVITYDKPINRSHTCNFTRKPQSSLTPWPSCDLSWIFHSFSSAMFMSCDYKNIWGSCFIATDSTHPPNEVLHKPLKHSLRFICLSHQVKKFSYIYIIISMQLWWNRQFWDVRSLLITGAKLFGNETSTAVIAKQTSVCLTETLIVKVEILTHDHDLRFTFELFQVR